MSQLHHSTFAIFIAVGLTASAGTQAVRLLQCQTQYRQRKPIDFLEEPNSRYADR